MKFCQQCGNQLSDDAVVCDKCNTAVTSYIPPSNQPVNEKTDENQPMRSSTWQSPSQENNPMKASQFSMYSPVTPMYASKPIMQQPVQPQPVQSQPMMQQPVQPQPMMQQPVQPQPIMQQPVQPQPIMQQPVQPQPMMQTYMNNMVGGIPQQPAPSKKKGKGGVLALIIIIIVAVAAIAGCLFYLFFIKGKTDENYDEAVNTYFDGYTDKNYSTTSSVLPSYKIEELSSTSMNAADHFNYMAANVNYSLTYEIQSSEKFSKEDLSLYKDTLEGSFGETGKLKNAYDVTVLVNVVYSTTDDSTSKDFTNNMVCGLIDDTWYITELGGNQVSDIVSNAKLYLVPFYTYFKGLSDFNIDLIYESFAPFDDDLFINKINTSYNGNPDELFSYSFYGYDIDLSVTPTTEIQFMQEDIDHYVSEIFDYYDVTPNISDGYYIDFNRTFTVYTDTTSNSDEGNGTAITLLIDGIWYYYDSSYTYLDVPSLLPQPEYSYNEFEEPLTTYFDGFFAQSEEQMENALPSYLQEEMQNTIAANYDSEDAFFDVYFGSGGDYGIGYYSVTDYTTYTTSDCIGYIETVYENYGTDVRVTGGYSIDVDLYVTYYFFDGTLDYDTVFSGTMEVICINDIWLIGDMYDYKLY